MTTTVKVFERSTNIDLRAYVKKIGGATFGSDRLEKVFYHEVFLPYGDILLRNAKREASKISRTGELASSLKVTGGQSGRFGVGLAIVGPAAKYGMIINKGGVIHATNKLLTIPFPAALNPATNQKIKPLSAYPSKLTFQRTYANSGRTIVYLKDFSTSRIYPPRRRVRNSKNKLVRPQPGIRPLFELKEEHYVPATHWADKAYEASRKELARLAENVARKYYNPRSRR